MYVQYVCACAFIQFAQTLHFFNSVKLHQASAVAILHNCLPVPLNFERKQMVRKLCWKRFQKIRKLLPGIQTKIPQISEGKSNEQKLKFPTIQGTAFFSQKSG